MKYKQCMFLSFHCRIVIRIAYMPQQLCIIMYMYIEFPDYSQWFKCFIFESLLRLIASVTQLNLITFVGLAE